LNLSSVESTVIDSVIQGRVQRTRVKGRCGKHRSDRHVGLLGLVGHYLGRMGVSWTHHLRLIVELSIKVFGSVHLEGYGGFCLRKSWVMISL
jgi:hypothetical protein